MRSTSIRRPLHGRRTRPAVLLALVTAVLAVLATMAPAQAAGASGPARPSRPAPAVHTGKTTIDGTITLAAGQSNAGQIYVGLYHDGTERAGLEARVDQRGRYTIKNVAPGTNYRVCASYDFQTACYADASTIGRATNLTVGSTPLRGIDVTFAAPGRVSGTVTVNGKPVANATVQLYPRSSYLVDNRTSPDMVGSYLSTDRLGHFAIDEVSPGSYIIGVDDDEKGRIQPTYSGGAATSRQAVPFTVTSEQSTTADIAARSASAISGTMRDSAGNPVAGVVYLYTVNAKGVTDYQSGDTTSDGRYTFSSLSPGRYVVEFVPDSHLLQVRWDGGAPTSADAPVITLAMGRRRGGVDAALPAGAEITGTLTDATSGDPVGFARVRLLQSDGAGGWTVVRTYQGYLGFGGGPEGYYDFAQLPPGTYRISATETGYHDLYLPGGSTPDQGADYVASAGRTSTVDATMDRAAAIVGRVLESGGSASDAQIAFYAEQPDGTFQRQPAGTVYLVDRVGDYRIAGLAPGTYRLQFSGRLYATEYFDDSTTLAGATDIVVTADHWSTADAVVQRVD